MTPAAAPPDSRQAPTALTWRTRSRRPAVAAPEQVHCGMIDVTCIERMIFTRPDTIEPFTVQRPAVPLMRELLALVLQHGTRFWLSGRS